MLEKESLEDKINRLKSEYEFQKSHVDALNDQICEMQDTMIINIINRYTQGETLMAPYDREFLLQILAEQENFKWIKRRLV